jgi:hypothetical protein
MMVPAMRPTAADLHERRDRPVSEMGGPAGIVDRSVIQKLMSADEAPLEEHWTFFVSANAQEDV